MSVTPGPPATTRFIESLLGKEVALKTFIMQGRVDRAYAESILQSTSVGSGSPLGGVAPAAAAR